MKVDTRIPVHRNMKEAGQFRDDTVRAILALMIILVSMGCSNGAEPSTAGGASSGGAESTAQLEDIKRVVTDKGFFTGDAIRGDWTVNEQSNVIQFFVRFGDAEKARQYFNGDQFEKSEVEEATERHRVLLKPRRFRLRDLVFQEIHVSEDPPTKSVTVVALAATPMRFRGEIAFREDRESCSGAVAMIRPSDVNRAHFAFLTKHATLQPCNWEESLVVRRKGGILYLLEGESTELAIAFKGERDLLKDIARNPHDYRVEIDFTNLEWSEPLTWGYFREDAYLAADRDCEKLRLGCLLQDANNPDPRPAYFMTSVVGDENDKQGRGRNKLVWATLTGLRVVHKESGKVIGGYKLPAE